VSAPAPIPAHLAAGTFADYLVRTRWYAGKGRPFEITGVRVVGEVPGRLEASAGGERSDRRQDSPHVVIHLVEVTYGDAPSDPEGNPRNSAVLPTAAPDRELYQVPLALYADAQPRLDHAFVGWWEDPELGWVHAYDALHDREAMACWLRSFDAASDGHVDAGTELAFHRLPGHDLDLEAHSTLFSGEQSNSSVAYGEDAVMKVFRKVTPGVNPDIQIHEVLTRAGSEHVAPLYGWLDVVVGEPEAGDEDAPSNVLQLAMLQEFLVTGSDGWDLALASVRTLFAEPEEHATDSGGDFAGEADRLAKALAHVHADLARHFPTRTLSSQETADLAAAMTGRLDAALGVVPQLAAYAPGLRELFARVADLDGVEVQTIHGDLHLGQTLRTSTGWKIVDFEGEPAKPLAERLLPDSPWRDVAGMLRSFDYAPHAVLHGMPPTETGEQREQLAVRASEWAHRNRNFFVVAYHETLHGQDELGPAEQVLLDAYVADKAVYECLYETRNRPTWLDIPLAAVGRIGAP